VIDLLVCDFRQTDWLYFVGLHYKLTGLIIRSPNVVGSPGNSANYLDKCWLDMDVLAESRDIHRNNTPNERESPAFVLGLSSS
jgi:hypothetical protein